MTLTMLVLLAPCGSPASEPEPADEAATAGPPAEPTLPTSEVEPLGAPHISVEPPLALAEPPGCRLDSITSEKHWWWARDEPKRIELRIEVDGSGRSVSVAPVAGPTEEKSVPPGVLAAVVECFSKAQFVEPRFPEYAFNITIMFDSREPAANGIDDLPSKLLLRRAWPASDAGDLGMLLGGEG